MQTYTIDKISDKNLRLIPQSTVKYAAISEADRRNAIWDMFVTKGGRCFFSVCAELYVCESAGLYEYVYETNEIKRHFDLDNVLCYGKDAIVPSKIHTSLSEMNDGRLIMTTHTTAQSPRHPYWYPEPFYNHVFEGYQGSSILIYDYNTGALENRGIPVPHESIYGGAYDPKHNAYYFTGYLRGHLYRYDIDDGKLTDYGKVTEFASFRLFRSEIDGNIYSANRGGYFYRINTDTQKIEELGIFFKRDYEPYSTEKHVQLDYIVDGKDGNIYLKYIFGYNIYRYNIKENRLELVGDGRPDDLELATPNQHYGMTVDENGVLWYTLSSFTAQYDWTGAYLIRWDVLNNKKPQNMGLVGNKERSISIMAEMHYHKGIIYLTCGNHHFDVPAMFAVDAKKLEALDCDLNKESDETPYSYDILNYLHLTDPRSRYPYGEAEFDRQFEKVKEFCRYSCEFGKFMAKNPMEIPAKHVEAYPVWRKHGFFNSRVERVRYEGDTLYYEFGCKDKFLASGDGAVEPIEEFSPQKAIIHIEDELIPYAVGRRFRARVTATQEIYDGIILAGTEDGILFTVKNGRSFCLGACPNTSGQVRDICYSAKTRTAYGIIGSDNDISIVFSFDEENGVKYLGRAHFNIESGLHLNCVLSCIAVNSDGTHIAIASNEEMGAVYDITL